MGLSVPNSDLQRLSEQIVRLYSATSLHDLVQAYFSVMSESIPADSLNYNEVDSAPPPPARTLREMTEAGEDLLMIDSVQKTLRWTVAATPLRSDLDAAELVAGFERNILGHPIIIACRRNRGLHTFRLSDVATDRAFERTPIYNEFFRLFPVRKQIVTYIGYGPEMELVLALCRGKGRDFSERDCDLMRLLTPHFRQAWLNVQALNSTRLEIMQGRNLLARHGAGLVCLAPEGGINWASPAAWEGLKEFFPPNSRNPTHLPPTVRDWFLRHPLVTLEGGPEASGQPLVAHSDRARLEVHLEPGTAGTWVLVLKRRQTKLSAVGFTYPDLTRRESEILYWIAQGRSNAAIALLQGISPRTINKHVQNIFSKMDVANRAEAIVAARNHLEDRD